MTTTGTAAAAVADMFTSPVSAHPAVAAAARIADEVLAPHAAAADDPARGVDPAHLALLADARLLSVTVPEAEGGFGAGPRVDAEAVERLSGACTATWFVTTQHNTPQALSRGTQGLPPDAITHGPAAARHRAGLADASTTAGIAIAHLRRPGPPTVRAEPDGTGWRFSGSADWCTGWGLIDLVMIAATTADDRFVLALLPAREQPGLRAGAPLPLSVMGGTRTVALEMDGLAVAAGDVLAVIDAPPWRVVDAARSANTKPAALGLLRRVLVGLAELGEARYRPESTDTALLLAPRAVELRAEAYALMDLPSAERVPERVAVRAELAELTVRAAHALVAARAGSALLTTSPEQRWAREAAFHLIQGQTAGVRAAQLGVFGRR